MRVSGRGSDRGSDGDHAGRCCGEEGLVPATPSTRSANQRIRLLTNRYSEADVAATPEAEIRISPTGEVILTGVDPLKLKVLR